MQRIPRRLTFPEWMYKAACHGVNRDSFFREERDPETQRVIRRFCENCPVRLDCLKDSIANDIRHGSRSYGVWGGVKGSDRNTLRKLVRRGENLDELARAWLANEESYRYVVEGWSPSNELVFVRKSNAALDAVMSYGRRTLRDTTGAGTVIAIDNATGNIMCKSNVRAEKKSAKAS